MPRVLWRRRCPFCLTFFRPHPRLGPRQWTCGAPACQQQRHAASRRPWRRRNRAVIRTHYRTTCTQPGRGPRQRRSPRARWPPSCAASAPRCETRSGRTPLGRRELAAVRGTHQRTDCGRRIGGLRGPKRLYNFHLTATFADGTRGAWQENANYLRRWRRGADSNRRIEVLQTSPLASWVPRRRSNHKRSGWGGQPEVAGRPLDRRLKGVAVISTATP